MVQRTKNITKIISIYSKVTSYPSLFDTNYYLIDVIVLRAKSRRFSVVSVSISYVVVKIQPKK